MSAQNNNNGTNNNEQKESEVEAAVGRTYVRGGDSSREGRLPVTLTRYVDAAQPQEVIVATQLDVLAKGSRRRGKDRHKLCISNL